MGQLPTPVVLDWPVKLWPPARTATGSPCSAVNPMAAATSSGVAQRTTASGRTPVKLSIAGRRAAS
jgi:hypothetical protein